MRMFRVDVELRLAVACGCFCVCEMTICHLVTVCVISGLVDLPVGIITPDYIKSLGVKKPRWRDLSNIILQRS